MFSDRHFRYPSNGKSRGRAARLEFWRLALKARRASGLQRLTTQISFQILFLAASRLIMPFIQQCSLAPACGV